MLISLTSADSNAMPFELKTFLNFVDDLTFQDNQTYAKRFSVNDK